VRNNRQIKTGITSTGVANPVVEPKMFDQIKKYKKSAIFPGKIFPKVSQIPR
jgi:hypothetical protein